MSASANQTASDGYEAAIDEVIATCDSSTRGALKALLIANELLEAEVKKLRYLQRITPRHERNAEAA